MVYEIKRFIILPVLAMVTLIAHGQSKVDISIPIEALADSMSVRPKPMLILISTDWCKFCQMQKAQIARSKEFKAARKHFYYAELNAESKEKVNFNGKVFNYKSTGLSTGIHELAIELGNKKGGVSYPTWVLLDKQYQVLLQHAGVFSSKELQSLLIAIEDLSR